MESASTWKKHVMDLATFYEGDLSSVDNINMEIVCWETKWKDHVGELPSKPKEMLVRCDFNYFPNIHSCENHLHIASNQLFM